MKKIITIIIAVHCSLFTVHHCEAQDTIYVPKNYPSIQQGIDAAVDGNVVLVDPDTYFENINFKGKAITVKSHYDPLKPDSSYIYNTIIDGSMPTDPDSGSVVYFISSEDSMSVLSGFTIQHGTGQFPNGWGDRSGGGVYCMYAGGKIIHNMIINNYVESDSTQSFGGGICAYSFSNNWIVIRDNYISGNKTYTYNTGDLAYGGGINAGLSSIIIERNHVKGNYVEGWSYGAGMAIERCYGLVKDNIVEDNELNVTMPVGLGAGIYVYNPQAGFKITQNTIQHNTCTGLQSRGGGIGIIDRGNNSDYYIDGNTIKENTSQYGGGINMAVSQFGCYITNNLIADNHASINGGAISFQYSSGKESTEQLMDREPNLSGKSEMLKSIEIPVITNNIFRNNDAEYNGGAFYNQYENADILAFNNIFYQNNASTAPDIYTSSNIISTVYLFHNNLDTNNIFGNWSGNENQAFDPKFHEDGCHLTNASLCIDAGTDSVEIRGGWYYCSDHDIDGEIRPQNFKPDIGADEMYIINPGINEPVGDNNINTFYPNPTKGIFSLHFTIDDLQLVSIRVYDLQGREVAMVLDCSMPPGEHLVQYDASELPTGMYFIRLQADKDTSVGKLIVR